MDKMGGGDPSERSMGSKESVVMKSLEIPVLAVRPDWNLERVCKPLSLLYSYYVEFPYFLFIERIRPSDGDVKPGDPLSSFREELAMSRHWLSLSPFLSSSHTTQLHYTNSYTYSLLTSTSYSSPCRYSSHT